MANTSTIDRVSSLTALSNQSSWPPLPLGEWRATRDTLHMMTQIVGKIRLELSPMMNHWWQVPLYVTSRGLTTSPIFHDTRIFQIDFDFIDHRLIIQTGTGEIRTLGLTSRPVAEFYHEVMDSLRSLGIMVHIWTMPVEVSDPIPFERDYLHAAYDADYAQRFWRALTQSHRVFMDFRSRFVGKDSPVHFFWGSFDLTVSRFSGRPAPPHPTVPGVSDRITRPAYSHEVSSAGFWPGGPGYEEAAFYSYVYPAPEGYSEYPIQPEEAFFSPTFGEFLLPYEAVRTAENPDAVLLAYCQSTYEAAANLGNWDRAMLEDPSALGRR